MGTISLSLALGKATKIVFFSALFEEKSIFSKDLPLEDDITEKTWSQFFWRCQLKIQNKYLIGFRKFFLENGKPDLNFQVAKIAAFGIF